MSVWRYRILLVVGYPGYLHFIYGQMQICLLSRTNDFGYLYVDIALLTVSSRSLVFYCQIIIISDISKRDHFFQGHLKLQK